MKWLRSERDSVTDTSDTEEVEPEEDDPVVEGADEDEEEDPEIVLDVDADEEESQEADLETRVEEQAERIEELEDLLLDLSTRVADGNDMGVCPDCHGPVLKMRRWVSPTTIECKRCGRVFHEY